MVCSKCQKKLKATELATPGVKRKNDMYYGSPSSTLGGGADKGKAKATLGATGIGKVCYKIFLSTLRIKMNYYFR
jgi:Microtubule-associated protein CRIPT.